MGRQRKNPDSTEATPETEGASTLAVRFVHFWSGALGPFVPKEEATLPTAIADSLVAEGVAEYLEE